MNVVLVYIISFFQHLSCYLIPSSVVRRATLAVHIVAPRHEVIIKAGHRCLTDLVSLDLLDGLVFFSQQSLNGDAACPGNSQHNLALVGKFHVVQFLRVDYLEP